MYTYYVNNHTYEGEGGNPDIWGLEDIDYEKRLTAIKAYKDPEAYRRQLEDELYHIRVVSSILLIIGSVIAIGVGFMLLKIGY